MPSVQLRSFGGLNTDSHIQDIRNGDYPDAKNIDHVSISDGQSMAVTPRLGNEYAFDLGEVLPQNKIYVITLPETLPETRMVLQFYDSSGTAPLLDGSPNGVAINGPSSVVAQIQNAFQANTNPPLSVIVEPASLLYPSITNPNSFAIYADPNSQYLQYYDFIIKSIGVSIIDVVVMAEAVSLSRSGELEVIGSYDLLGDLFILSSPKRERPIELSVVQAQTFSFFSGCLFNLGNIPDDVQISQYQEIFVSGVEDAPWANGIFMVAATYLDPATGVTLIAVINPIANSPAGASESIPNTGTLILNPYGLGEIGVAVKDLSKDQWTYTRLLRSKELGLTVYNQCDVVGDTSSEVKSLYIVDKNSANKIFSYPQAADYIQDGAVSSLNPSTGFYTYGSILDQTRLIQGQPAFDIDYISQGQSGGSLSAGNHRYFVRGVLRDNSKTDWSLPSGAIPVYAASITGNPDLVIGSAEGTQTGKYNNIRISNINSSLYQSIEVACVLYLDIGLDTTTYGVFAVSAVSQGVTTLDITHTGREESSIDLIADELSVESVVYPKAKNVEIIDNRLLLSNLSTPNEEDIKKMLSTAKYTLKQKEISAPALHPQRYIGGYQDPENVFRFTGFMYNETYRISARVRFKSGYITNIEKLFDVTFNTDPAGPDHPGRISGLPNYNITNPDFSGAQRGYMVPHLEISGIDATNSLIDGLPASLVVERIEFFRAEVLKKKIVGYTIAIPHVQSSIEGGAPGDQTAPFYRNAAMGITPIVFAADLPTGVTVSEVPNTSKEGETPIVSFEFPFTAGSEETPLGRSAFQVSFGLQDNIRYEDDRLTMGSPALNGTNSGFKWNNLLYSIYVCDDLVTGTETVIFENLSGIINYGCPYKATPDPIEVTFGQANSFYSAYSGYGIDQSQSQQVVKLRKLIPEEGTILFEGQYVTKYLGKQRITNYQNRPGYIVKLASPLSKIDKPQIYSYSPQDPNFSPDGLEFDWGIRLCQVTNTLFTSQYSEENQDQYVYTGSFQLPSGSSSIDVFGGDAFSCDVKIRTLVNLNVPPLTNPNVRAINQAIVVPIQSRLNHSLIIKQEDVPLWPFDYATVPVVAQLDEWIKQDSLDQYFYNRGYNLELIIAYKISLAFKITSYQTRIIYSDLKVQGSQVNNYRRFGLLSYTDLDPSFGEITDMKNVNGELFTLQPNKYQRQFFNTRGTLQLSDASQIVLGDASVLSRPGITITSFGCSDKWSVKKGRSQGGDDVLYWYDKLRKKFIRFGSDGAVPLSDRSMIRTLASDGFKWLLNNGTPAQDYGIHGVWNQLLSETTWTCRAYRKPDNAWSLGADIQQGELVYLKDEINFINFEQTTVLYVALQTHTATNETKPGQGVDWQLYFSRPSVDNQEYYSIRTISFSELKNRFIARDEEPHPRIYLQWQDTYLSPRPVGSLSRVYEHNSGSYLKWYELNGDSQTGEGYIDVVFNIDPNTVKRFISVICNSEIQPTRLELFTKSQQTVITPAEFEEQLEQFVAPIPNKLLSGQTTLDNDFMYGQWVKIRFFYSPEQFQRLTNIVLKFNPMARLWSS